jgi:hypothetical protein
LWFPAGGALSLELSIIDIDDYSIKGEQVSEETISKAIVTVNMLLGLGGARAGKMCERAGVRKLLRKNIVTRSFTICPATTIPRWRSWR